MRVEKPQCAMLYPNSVSLLISFAAESFATSMRNVLPGGLVVVPPFQAEPVNDAAPDGRVIERVGRGRCHRLTLHPW